MATSYRIVFRLALPIVLVLNPGAFAASFCVGTESALEAALATAAGNGENNTISVRSGTYDAPSGGFIYQHASGNTHLDLEGGWNAGCSVQTPRAALTVLDGQSAHSILKLFDNAPGTTGNMTLRYFDLSHGADENGYRAALTMFGYDGTLRVENCRIRNNVSGGGRILSIEGHGGTLHFRGNVVADNAAPGDSSLLTFSLNNGLGHMFINNNTVADNVFATTVPASGTLSVYRATLSNNILWNNGGSEVRSGDDPLMIDNDIDQLDLEPAAGSNGNIDVDPLFIGDHDRHIPYASPARDAGMNAPAGGVLPVDTDGNPRNVFGHIDIGAYEVQDILFTDGFDG